MRSHSNRDRATARSSKGATPDDELDLGAHLGILLEHRWPIAATLVISLLVGATYMAVATPIYRANAVLQIEQEGGGVDGLEELFGDLSGQVSTEMEVLSSRELLGRVVDELRLDVSAKPLRFPFMGAMLALAHQGPGLAEPPWAYLGEYAWGGERIRVDKLVVPGELEDVPLTLVAGEAGAYTLLGPDSTPLLSGRVGTPATTPPGSPQRVELQVSELQARPGTRFQVRRRSRLQVVESLQRSLRLSEKGVSTGVLIAVLEGPDPEGISATLQAIVKHYVHQNVQRRNEEAERALAFLDSQLPGLRQELERAEAALSAHRAGKGTVDLDLETKALLDRGIEIDASLSQLELQRTELQQRFTGRHPMMRTANRKLARLRAERDALNARLKALPAVDVEAARLQRDVEVANALYRQLNNKAQEYRVLKSSTVGTARILDEAVVTREPVRPSQAGVLTVSIVMGLTLGVALAFTRQALQRGVSDPAALEARLGLPVYASIPLMKSPSLRARGMHTVVARTHPRDVVVESLRGLRTSLQFAMKDAPNNVVAITGPSPGVGKSFIAVNLAWVLADSGKRILLVDANLRGGWLHRCFGVARSQGLSELISGTAGVDEVIQPVHERRLSFLSTGELPPNPAELLLSDRFAALVAWMSAEYDLVLIDTPPILAVTDAALVGRHAGVSLMVVRAGAHPMREVVAAVKRLELNGVQARGVIFNGVPRSPRGRAVSGIYQYEYPAAG
ncbi:polysaccharide biosynthesis tyrosine autokinase [Myxococcus sp. RHSTA-1-4]|uniref:polysaccharide biosynthesis tyrosine autokinase n=1 Tax=Myxococcus sp. RHSTA-1-4 TaxID=2874601 RepID=UPI001CC0FCD3|nr:polysaccharide biosynthesis tyrosine autokinase [Myxococcus sp. RHSTA-1-4]MBZ4420121.1 polysaccharide biosynthesis tyrosine autokinase [Myxococcus sp. RHSTA-1-4]